MLDFGAGTGANCRICSPHHYLGVDPDAKRIALARKLYPGYSFQVMDKSTLPFENHSFDYILLISVLHHIPSTEIEHFLQQFRHILKPQGKIISIEPCLCSDTPFSNRFMRLYDSGKYIRDEEGYLDLFRKHRFRCNVFKRFKKCFVYNELFFSAVPES